LPGRQVSRIFGLTHTFSVTVAFYRWPAGLVFFLHIAAASAGQIFEKEPTTMAIEKKSLINTLKTTKKANVASAPATNEGVSTRKAAKKAALKMRRMRRID
jgi:hypothetical protein